jgi:peroxiredoxin/mono/diheme cytochrome c family protein
MLILLSGSLHAAEQVNPKVGTPVADFELTKVTDGSWKLSDAKDAKLVVVTFIGTECPLMHHYGTRLEKLAAEWSPRGVQFVAIDPNIQDSREEVASFAQKFGMSFPVLKDDGSRVADLLGATRTPQVILLDATRTIRYSGPIDDQGRVGYVRMKLDRDHLSAAINELLEDQPVSQPNLSPIGCLIGRQREASEGTVTYAKEISRIFQARCVECHRRGEIGPFAMDNYDEIVGWAEMIDEVVKNERMPPWFANAEPGKFSNDCRLTKEEKDQISTWVAAGAPYGNAKDLPTPRKFHDGWNIGQPDEIVNMTETAYDVPADGSVPYQHFVVDPGWTEEKWLTACEVRPGVRSVVHHVFVFCLPPDVFPPDAKGSVEIKGKKLGLAVAKTIFDGGLIGGYAPGTPPFAQTPGVGLRLPAGSKLLFQMHYTPSGRPEKDLTSIGFKYGDPKTITHEFEMIGAKNFRFIIPPNVSDHVLKSSYTFQQDCRINELVPHMHLRGKSFQFVARYPDGKTELLLDVPKYDFNWQIPYKTAKPYFMPKGTVMECTGHYDNSKNNPANPNPNAIVRPGEQTWDEMMIGWFSMITPRKDLPNVEKTRDDKDLSAR